jgi:hypothetical protein
MRFLIMAALGAAIAAAPAAAGEKKPEDPDKKICKFENSSTSRVAKKVCKTRAEWKALEQEGDKSATPDFRAAGTNN